ncbi:MAG: nitroreductase family protein [Pirellulales bacterium]|nr:nitroreductase family protein [Pirellulales bacterium]
MSTKTDIFQRVAETQHVEPALATNAEEFEKVVRSRRSTRAYRDDPIPEEVMRHCLNLTLIAPNSSNLQPWEFY